jgi:glucosamine-6-phosphate deaminase
MPPIRIIPARDEENVNQKLATLLLAAVEEKPDLIVAVFAGTPAFGTYRLLAERAAAEDVDFSRVRFVVFDELLRPGGGAPFRAVLQERLFAPLEVPAENIVAFDPTADRQAEARRVSAWLSVAGIDVALLSADARGHIGFHATGSTLESQAGIVPVENRERWGAPEAFSLGLADLARATRILLFASGKNLAEIVRSLTEGSFDPGKPISVLQRHPDVILIADRSALSRIEGVEKISGFHAGLFILDPTSAPSGRRVLVVSPHPDDAPISLGGTMALLAAQNRVVTAVMSTGHRSFIYGTQREERIAIREKEVVKESRILGAEPRFLRLPFYEANYDVTEKDLAAFTALLEEVSPDWVFMPHRADAHPAHVASRRIALESLQRFLRGSGGSVETWDFEGPWALFNRGDFNTIVPVPRVPFERKIEAIRAHISQVSRTPYDVAAESLARLRSALVPESELAGYGGKPPRLEPYLELFHRQVVRAEQALVAERP